MSAAKGHAISAELGVQLSALEAQITEHTRTAVALESVNDGWRNAIAEAKAELASIEHELRSKTECMDRVRAELAAAESHVLTIIKLLGAGK